MESTRGGDSHCGRQGGHLAVVDIPEQTGNHEDSLLWSRALLKSTGRPAAAWSPTRAGVALPAGPWHGLQGF